MKNVNDLRISQVNEDGLSKINSSLRGLAKKAKGKLIWLRSAVGTRLFKSEPFRAESEEGKPTNQREGLSAVSPTLFLDPYKKVFDSGGELITTELDNSMAYDFFRTDVSKPELKKELQTLKFIERKFKEHGLRIGYVLGPNKTVTY